jgi:hypothetical protein
MTRMEQKLRTEELMPTKHVKFKAKISEMGDKYIIIIPTAYHDDIDKKNWKKKFLYLDIADEEF